MSFAPFKAHVGPHRTSQNTTGQFTRSVRADMNSIIKNFKAFAKHMEGLNADILYSALEPVFKESQKRVPKDTRALMHSGYLTKRSFRGKSIVEVGYGKASNPPYAAIVHERLDMRHKEGETAKFLENPLREQEKAIQARIVKGVKEASGV